MGVVLEGADVDLGGSKTSQPCSKRSLRQIQSGDCEHVWGGCRANSEYREGCVENVRQMPEPSEHPGTVAPARLCLSVQPCTSPSEGVYVRRQNKVSNGSETGNVQAYRNPGQTLHK